MVGVWCLSLWHDLGRPPRIRLVELGPGRGTLLADLLRALTPFTHFLSALELHLVEASAQHLTAHVLHLPLASEHCKVSRTIVVSLKDRGLPSALAIGSLFLTICR